MDKLLETLNNFLKEAGHTISSNAPQVWDATLHLIQINAWVHVINDLVWTTVIVVLWVWPWRILLFKSVNNGWDDFYPGGLWVCLSIGLVISSAVAVDTWSNAGQYLVAIIDPRLGVIYTLADKAGLL